MNQAHAAQEHAEMNPKHFDLLRIAKLRGLKVRKLGETTYAVTSYSRPGLEWVVTGDVCTCPAKGFCTHRAAALDFYYINDAPVGDFTDYRKDDISDRAQLRLRIRAGELTRNDKIYVRFCVWFYERKRRAAKVNTGIRTVETTRHGRKTVRHYVGAIQI